MIYAIIGLGVAGITAAKTIRSLDENGEIHVFSEEPTLYYPRPKLFDVIAGEVKAKDLYFYGSEWYNEKRINLHLGWGVRKIDKDAHTLLLEYGGTFKYDKLLIANGSEPFVPPIEGIRTEGVFTLRTLADAFSIRRHSALIGNNSPVVVIGGGLLGLEAAHSFRSNKLRPTVLQDGPHLLPRQIDKEGADILKGIFENMGIHIKVDSKTTEIAGRGRAEKVILENGEKLDAEMVLVSTGIKPRVDLLDRSGFEYKRGVQVNEYLQIDEDIYAAGDIAEYQGRVYGIIPPAIDQGMVAAANMVKADSRKYAGSVPQHTLKVAGIDFTSIGIVNCDEVNPTYKAIRAKSPLEGKYRKVVLENGKIVGIVLLGIKGEGVHAVKLVNNRVDASSYIDKLADLSFSLKNIPV